MNSRTWPGLSVPAFIVTFYALILIVVPAARPPFLRDRVITVPIAVFVHLAGGAAAMALGPFQLNQRFRDRNIRVHRKLGYAYLASVLAGGASGLVLARVSQGGLVAHFGFAALGTLWILTVLAAYRAIRGGDQANHRKWMFRNYSLTFAAVTLRIYLPLSLVIGLPFAKAYPAISWLCWIPNLLITELWIIPRSHETVEARRTAR